MGCKYLTLPLILSYMVMIAIAYNTYTMSKVTIISISSINYNITWCKYFHTMLTLIVSFPPFSKTYFFCVPIRICMSSLSHVYSKFVLGRPSFPGTQCRFMISPARGVELQLIDVLYTATNIKFDKYTFINLEEWQTLLIYLEGRGITWHIRIGVIVYD